MLQHSAHGLAVKDTRKVDINEYVAERVGNNLVIGLLS